MARREFTKAVMAQIVLRATNAQGHVVCEGCGLVLGKRPYHIDHTIPDALTVEKRKLSRDDGKLLGVECCHAPKTKIDVANIAEAKRREAAHLGIKAAPPRPIKSAPFQKSAKAAKRVEKPALPVRPFYQENAT
jgi:hypothetical protein